MISNVRKTIIMIMKLNNDNNDPLCMASFLLSVAYHVPDRQREGTRISGQTSTNQCVSSTILISEYQDISECQDFSECPNIGISENIRILYVHHPMCFFNSPHLTLYHLRLKWNSPSIYKLFWSLLFDSKGWSMIISNEKSFLNTKEHYFNGVICSFFL